jgi:hypothetical protein
MARVITCKNCQASVTLYDDAADPHAALECGCCDQDHHHGAAAETTGEPCRPVHHLYIGELGAPGNVSLTSG